MAQMLLPAPTSITRRAIRTGCPRQIVKAGKASLEGQTTCSDRAIPLLADNNFCCALICTILVIVFVTIQEQDYVCILFDSA